MSVCILCGMPFGSSPWYNHRMKTKCVKSCCQDCCSASFGNCTPEKPIPKTEEETAKSNKPKKPMKMKFERK